MMNKIKELRETAQELRSIARDCCSDRYGGFGMEYVGYIDNAERLERQADELEEMMK